MTSELRLTGPLSCATVWPTLAALLGSSAVSASHGRLGCLDMTTSLCVNMACVCRVLEPLTSAAEVYEDLENCRRAAECWYLVACICESTCKEGLRNKAADAWLRLTASSL